jgi:hypothetical protein
MKTMQVFIFLTFLFSSIFSYADSLNLVTDQEVIASRLNRSVISPKMAIAPDAPKIDLITPNIGSSIASPTPIELKFFPKTPAVVKPESFKAYYGSLGIDITNRLLKVAQVTPLGINVSEANLPKGSHRITINVEDSEGRKGSKILEFEIK